MASRLLVLAFVKPSFPHGEGGLLMVKDDSVSSCPDRPTSCNEDFSETRSPKISALAFMTISGEVCAPLDRNKAPGV